MRFILRRLGFYAIALWGAITLNFLLPRLMPGSPLDGLMSRLSPVAARREPAHGGEPAGVPERAEGAVLPGVLDATSGRSSPVTSASRPRTSRRPSPKSSRGRFPTRSRSSAWASCSPSSSARRLGMVAAWRRGGLVDNLVTPALISLGAFPAFFTALLAVYFLGLKWGWFPIQHAYDLGDRARLQLALHPQRGRPRDAPRADHRRRLRRRLAPEHAQRDDQHRRGGLRRHGRTPRA